MAKIIHRLISKIVFPEGVSPGEGQLANRLALARDGIGRPVLRGTALAGALRHAWARHHGVATEDALVTKWFGDANTNDAYHPSLLKVSDCRLETGGQGESWRTHNAIDRHTGSVMGGAHFEVEALPPDTSTDLVLWLECDERDEARAFMGSLVALLKGGLTVGGHSSRGLGRLQLVGEPSYRAFDCANLDQQAEYMDERYKIREGIFPITGETLMPVGAGDKDLRIDLVLSIPPGEDLLVGEGDGGEFDLGPQKVVGADGKTRWRLPGSSLRGVFRGWMSRLAAREGHPVADNYARHLDMIGNDLAPKGDQVGWGYAENHERVHIQDALIADPGSLEKEVPCPIMRLFGSLYSRGRVHIGDALSEQPSTDNQVQLRKHVAIDRISGGANEGFLFDAHVLTGGVRFKTQVTIQNPSGDEVRWLASSLAALHYGVLRVGTSKASGRLRLEKESRATGLQSESTNITFQKLFSEGV